jgi:REP element-mobilizing transposase RayT
VHVRLRTVSRALRTPRVFPTLREAIAQGARQTESFRIVEFSVQDAEVHLIVEAATQTALTEGVRGLCIRIARAVNPLLEVRGRFFGERWQGRALTTPREVRDALIQLLGDVRNQKRPKANVNALDAYSSAEASMVAAQTTLLRSARKRLA